MTDYCITCSLCGRSWRQTTIDTHTPVPCRFCGTPGHLRPGPIPEDFGFLDRIEVSLDCLPRPRPAAD